MRYKASTLVEVVVASVLIGLAFIIFMAAYLRITSTSFGVRHHQLNSQCDHILSTLSLSDFDEDIITKEMDGFVIRLTLTPMEPVGKRYRVDLVALENRHQILQRQVIKYWP